MTEDDTFLALRKATYADAKETFKNWYLNRKTGSGMDPDVVLKPIGWDYTELWPIMMKDAEDQLENRR